MKKNQNGFSFVGVFIALIVIGVLGGAGWLVYDRHKSNESKNDSVQAITKQTPAATTNHNAKQLSEIKDLPVYNGELKTYTDEGGYYSVSYPATWTTEKAKDTVDFISPAATKPKNSYNLTLLFSAFSQQADGRAIMRNQSLSDDTPQSIEINGDKAYYLKSTVPKTGAIVHDFVMTKGNYSIFASFTQKLDTDPAFDDTVDLPAFRTTVESIKFLK